MTTLSESRNAIHITMPASLESIDEADSEVTGFLLRSGVSIDRFAVRIILREALLNAVLHGSGEDADKSVELTGHLDDRGMTLTIRDSGPGFAWRKAWGPTEPRLDGGRGLPLMRAYASEVRFNEMGNQVTLLRTYTPEVDMLTASAGGVE